MSEPTPDGSPTRDADVPPIRRLRVRRAPRYEVFVGTGAAIGLLVALVSGTSGTTDPQTGRAKLVGYLAMGLVLIGGLLGGLVAIAVERFRSHSRIDDRRDPETVATPETVETVETVETPETVGTAETVETPETVGTAETPDTRGDEGTADRRRD